MRSSTTITTSNRLSCGRTAFFSPAISENNEKDGSHMTTIINHNHNGKTYQHEHEQTGVEPRTPEQRRRAGKRARLILAVIGGGVLAAGAATTYPRLATSKALAET